MESQLLGLIDLLELIYRYAIIVYILMSWIPAARDSVVGEWLGRLVEPYLAPFRRIIPPIGGMIDISPIVALFALYFLAGGLKWVVAFLIPGGQT